MKSDLCSYVVDSITEGFPKNPVDYGFKDLVDVFKAMDDLMINVVTGKLEKEEEYDYYVYTDGSYLRRNDICGLGVVIVDKEGKEIFSYGSGWKNESNTGNFAELEAISSAINYLKTNLDISDKKVIIYSDSKYSVNCVTSWYKKWITNGWLTSEGNPVKNQEVIKKILDQIAEFPAYLDIEWIKGHNSNKHNIKADEIARGYSEELEYELSYDDYEEYPF